MAFAMFSFELNFKKEWKMITLCLIRVSRSVPTFLELRLHILLFLLRVYTRASKCIPHELTESSLFLLS